MTERATNQTIRQIPISFLQVGGYQRPTNTAQVAAFQNDPGVTVFIGQIATAGLGITLTAASTMVFYSLDYSMSNYEQTRARIHRVGQRQPCTYIHLVAKGTVDEKVLQALRDKANLAKALVDDYRNGRNPFTTETGGHNHDERTWDPDD